MLFFIDLKSSSVQEQSFKIRRKGKGGYLNLRLLLLLHKKHEANPVRSIIGFSTPPAKRKDFHTHWYKFFFFFILMENIFFFPPLFYRFFILCSTQGIFVGVSYYASPFSKKKKDVRNKAPNNWKGPHSITHKKKWTTYVFELMQRDTFCVRFFPRW